MSPGLVGLPDGKCPGWGIGWEFRQPSPQRILSWAGLTSAELAAVPGTSTVPFSGHACPYSQRLETLQQNCQVVCALLQGAIESMKAVPQPMESGVSVLS